MFKTSQRAPFTIFRHYATYRRQKNFEKKFKKIESRKNPVIRGRLVYHVAGKRFIVERRRQQLELLPRLKPQKRLLLKSGNQHIFGAVLIFIRIVIRKTSAVPKIFGALGKI